MRIEGRRCPKGHVKCNGSRDAFLWTFSQETFGREVPSKQGTLKRVTLQVVPGPLTGQFPQSCLSSSIFALQGVSRLGVARGKLGQRTRYKPREPSPSGPQGEEEQRGEFRIQVPKTPSLCPVLAPGKGPVVQVSHCSTKNGSLQRLASVPGRVLALQPALTYHHVTAVE